MSPLSDQLFQPAMPPRLAARPTVDASASHASRSDASKITENDIDDFRAQDAYLPIATIARIMRKSLPDDAKLSKSSRECIQECASEFISFVTSEAAERAHNERRRTLTGDDLLVALNSLGLENYGEVAKIYLAKYRTWMAQTQEKQGQRNRKQPEAESGSDAALFIQPSAVEILTHRK